MMSAALTTIFLMIPPPPPTFQMVPDVVWSRRIEDVFSVTMNCNLVHDPHTQAKLDRILQAIEGCE